MEALGLATLGIVEIQTYELGPVATNGYLLFPKGRDDALLIDAPAEVFDLIQPELKKNSRRLAAVVLTHGHWDHIVDAAACQAAGATIYAHVGDKDWIENPMIQAPFMLPGIELNPVRIDRELTHGQTLELCGESFEIRHVPGHAPGSVLLYHRGLGCAFVGDAIFAGSVGRTDLPGGDWDELETSIRSQIYTLPATTTLFPGHGPPTTVATERATNGFVR